MKTFSNEAGDKYPDNWNGKTVNKFGFQICQGLKAFAESDYEEAFRLMLPIRFDWLQLMPGSHAQIDLLNQVLIQSAIKSSKKNAAKALFKERMASCNLIGNPEDVLSFLNGRIDAKIQSII